MGEGLAALAPLALTLAVVVCGERVRDRRRCRALNACLHELRRPLQALTLNRAGRERDTDHLELALAALEDLDREVNRERRAPAPRAVDARAIATAAVERNRGHAARQGRRICLRWECLVRVAGADPRRLSQALDNLIDNALRHGRGTVTVRASVRGERLRLSVVDEGAAQVQRPRRDPRHGHGLALARSAAGQRGHLRLVTGQFGSVAWLELPMVRARRS